MSRDLSLSQLTTELTDFLGLPADMDLPPVSRVSCERGIGGGWKAEARVAGATDADKVEALSAWASLAGGAVEASGPYPSQTQPSGAQRTLSVRIVVAQVPIELYACVDGLFAVPQPEAVTL